MRDSRIGRTDRRLQRTVFSILSTQWKLLIGFDQSKQIIFSEKTEKEKNCSFCDLLSFIIATVTIEHFSVTHQRMLHSCDTVLVSNKNSDSFRVSVAIELFGEFSLTLSAALFVAPTKNYRRIDID